MLDCYCVLLIVLSIVLCMYISGGAFVLVGCCLCSLYWLIVLLVVVFASATQFGFEVCFVCVYLVVGCLCWCMVDVGA